MSTTVRIIIGIICVIALYYLVIMLSRSVANESPPPSGGVTSPDATQVADAAPSSAWSASVRRFSAAG